MLRKNVHFRWDTQLLAGLIAKPLKEMDFSTTMLLWHKYPTSEIPIFRTVQLAKISPAIMLWHAQYNPLRFSSSSPKTKQSLRIAKLDSAPVKRQAEYWAGRRLMMLAFGLQTPPGRMPSGAPHLPNGVGGSLSHSSDHILLLAGPEGTYMGVDIERQLTPTALQSVINRVATQAEQRWLHSLEASQQQLSATVLFSAKETLFKALCFKMNVNPGYAAVEAPRPPQHGVLSFKLTRYLGSGLDNSQCFKLSYAQMNDFVLTWLCQSSI